ncbi:DUF262 domain-containing HNH endonuclease family protein [Romboutsia sedimentorum]|uniref:DUF262 domain-containing protein n=1 Tax=Romboutsia sedimentorum TaxID=1368474 RepID=UPI0024DE7230|nr:DUF262 domain-containing HNH endonuclease family protein [Romboutsia sedimentorum]MDK2587383.1 DUF262 domain-containing HNH endonuclease family protein [Romboutsia sedimentorum]
MNFTQRTILELFVVPKKQFNIPVYQRAYSWEESEWKKFIEDIEEQVNSENDYYYGNLLLETIKIGKEYDIIDGQQRITTITIFIRALLDVLKTRQDTNIEIEDKEKIYFKNAGTIKLRPVDYDRACYNSIIVDGNSRYETDTDSQKRMLKAKEYFYNYLTSKKDTDIVENFLEVVEDAQVNCIELKGKKEAALMFELENNRGKDLTNLEKLKSYFMYQMHVSSKEDETDLNIENISDIFKKIYSIVNKLSINEDSLLIYHCNAYINGYDYRNIDDIKEKLKIADNKVEFIRDFTKELHISFANIEKLENSKNKYLKQMKKLKIPAFIYPFLVKGMRYLDENSIDMDNLYDVMEKIIFRQKLINSRADIKSRLNNILKSFKGDVEWLRLEIDKILNDAWYWSDDKVEDILKSYMCGNDVLKYILYNYENFIQSKGYLVGDIEVKDDEIEHISPQTPRIKSGYEVNDNGKYSEKFEGEYLNCLGNLVVISKSHNCSIGNCNFDKKLKSYMKNPILNQQAEIKAFISGDLENPIWDSEAIQRRHDKILKFALDRWSFKNLSI